LCSCSFGWLNNVLLKMNLDSGRSGAPPWGDARPPP